MSQPNTLRWGTLLFAVAAILTGCTKPAQEPRQDIVFIQDGTVIDGTGAAPQTGTGILIREDRIEAVGTELVPPERATIIDATGMFVVPGIIDTHAHLDSVMVFQVSPEEKEEIVEHNGHAFLYNGVTTVLNFSSKEDWWKRRAAQREGRIVSPRIYAMGRSFTPEDGWGSRHGGAVKDADDARKRTQELVALGTDGFKVIIEDGLGVSRTYKMIPDDMLEAISEVAHHENVPLYIHAMNLGEYRKAIAVKPRAIVHGLEDPIPEGDPLLEELVENDIYVVPTQSLWGAFTHRPENFEDPILRASVPGFLLDNMRSLEYMSEERARFQKVARMDAYTWVQEKVPVFKENVTKMHRAGVKLATGTDAGGPVGYNFQGYNTPWELELLVECGLTPMDALVAATRNGAETIGVQDKLGTLEPGKWADLLILEANPLDDIRNIRTVEQVVLGGKVFSRDDFAYRGSGLQDNPPSE